MKKPSIYRLLGSCALFVALSAVSSTAGARGHFGVSGPLGGHVGTNGSGISLPTPEASIGIDGPYGSDATISANPHGVRAGVAGPYGTSAGVSSDGDASVGAYEDLPGGSYASGHVGTDGSSADTGVYIPVENAYYSGI